MKKMLSLMLCVVMVFFMFPTSALALTQDDATSFSVTNANVEIDGTEDKTVTIAFCGTADDTYSTITGTFEKSDTTNYVTLTEMSAGYTVDDYTNYANAATGQFKLSQPATGSFFNANVPIVTTTYTVAKDTPAGTYTVDVYIETSENFDGDYLDEQTYTATITVTEPTAPAADYEICYTLDSEVDEDSDNYKDYEIGDQVTAEIFLVSNNADVTLQAYDIYLTYNPEELSYNSLGADMAGTAYKTVDEDNKVEAEEGDTVTHIQLVADNKECVELEKEKETSLGTIVFDIADGVKYGQELEITLTYGTTNISLALTDTVDTQGDKNAYYPIVKGDDLGAEVTTTYTVTYDANGGSGAPDEQTKFYNESLTLSNTEPIYDGYIFKGWTTAVNPALDAEVEYQAGGSYTVNEDVTLYAVWQQNTFTVKWYDASGNVIETDENVASGSAPSFDGSNPDKTDTAEFDYTFIGWNTDSTATTALNLANEKITADTNYYPIFSSTTQTYTVTWNNADNSLLEKDENVPYGSTPTYDSGTPTKADSEDGQYTYAFAGWTPEVSAITGDTTYTATFTESIRSYTVKFATEANGSLTDTNDQTVAFGNKPTYPTVTANAGYEFDGWYVDGNKIDSSTYTISGEVTLTAKYNAVDYTITLNVNGGDALASSEITYKITDTVTLPSATKTGATFDGWKLETTVDGWEANTYAAGEYSGKYGNITLVAQWTDKSYTITTGSVTGGSIGTDVNSANYGDTITLSNTPADGYEFVSYTVTDNSGNSIDVNNGKFTMPDSNVTVSATFKALDLTVKVDTVTKGTVNIESGETDVTEKTDAHVGDTITLNVTPNTGYKVKSVTYIKTGDDTATAENATAGANGTYTFTMPAYGVTVNVEFEAISYTIAFDGHSATSGNMNPIADVKYGVGQTLTNNSFTKNGYKFLGWSTDANATAATYNDGQSVSNLTTIDGDTVTLYAVWGEDTFSVTLKTNGGEYAEGYTAPTTYTYGTGATLPTADNITKTGYDFDGWYDNANLTGKAATTIGGDEYGAKEYWAKWTPAEYNIILKPGDGASYDDDVTVPDSYVYGVGTELPTPTKPGYEFVGWYDGETKVESITGTDIGDKTLTAQWTAIPYTITFELEGGTLETDASNPMTYTIESTGTLPAATRENYTFAGWKVTVADGNWTIDSVINADTKITGNYGNVTLTAQWNRAATPVVEQYKYAYTGYWMLRVDASNVVVGQEYQFNGKPMYYIEDANYAVNGSNKVFYTLIPVSKDGVTYVDTNNSQLTDEGYKLLKIVDCDTRSFITYDGDINGDGVVNIADANTVYQMVQATGSYYSDTQLDIAQRLAADMVKSTEDTDHRGSIADVNAIVNIINGVPNN